MREQPPWDEIDTGIRQTVRWLFDHGFDPIDSGDGRAKFDDEGTPYPGYGLVDEDGSDAMDEDGEPLSMAMPFPNVTCQVDTAQLISEADRLAELLETEGLTLNATIEDGIAIAAFYLPRAGKDITGAQIQIANLEDASWPWLPVGD